MLAPMTLPEALRTAPNLEIMRIDALDYSTGARVLHRLLICLLVL